MSISDIQVFEQVQGIDTMDLGMVGDRSFEKVVRDWGEVSHVEVVPGADTLVRDGHDIRLQAELEIAYKDESVLTRTIAIHASDEHGVFGLRDIGIVQQTADA